MDYKNGQIYCIRSHQTDLIYIGSTCSPLYKRFHGHKTTKNCTSTELMKYADAYIELIEDFPCNSKKELNRREGQHIRNAENCVNKRIAGRSKEERYIDNKKQILEQVKEYYEENKEHILEKKKQWHEQNKQKICEQKKQRYLKKKLTASEGSSSSSP